MSVRKRVSKYFYNRLTIYSFVFAAVCFALIVFLTLVDAFSNAGGHPYMGILTFIVLPIFLNGGLAIAVLGMILARRRARAAGGVDPATFHFDLRSPQHRRGAVLLAVGAPIFLMVSAAGSYEAYETTDSVRFCGEVCHNVMKPEYVAYQNSPHSRVGCVDCHIGSGATWFVRSKLSGSYQVYSVLFNKYHRPIEAPVKNLRPARETCEQCHWPKHFYAAKLQQKNYYMSDDQNTHSQLNLLVKVGGGDAQHSATEGIHYHMYIKNTIRYVSTDRKNLVIPYVECKGADGSLTVYRSTETPLSDAKIRTSEKHLVDCIECHNRPTHRYNPPASSVNTAMSLCRIDPVLPNIKQQAVEALGKPYKTEDEALTSIRQTLTAYYKTQPSAAGKGSQIDGAIKEIQHIYSTNFFPEMHVSWKEFPDHIGHMYSQGCFRCHDGKHVSAEGKKITNDCNACHTILSQAVDKGGEKVSLRGLEFRHPVEIGDAWKTTKCVDCHASQ